ncbi:Brp/Blh family beta-carotene 15,15'-dioxygenase [Brevundimonas sp.]|uniref:Brp/Blh family beta-carotene 15,15'-dioxygenase n=1 Tax=Brevundimonas sp. TaxID=1871086 RepID=UPI00286A66D0|nr:Brp/Blh family beta-carotene 15,15'-dioxygenase [Brevundimonas sp.]
MTSSSGLPSCGAKAPPGVRLILGALALALVGLWVGVPLSGQTATSMACLALLVFGLPHGTLDLELIRARSSGPWMGMAALVAIYLALAALMYGLWRVEPVVALAAFIGIAVVHFSEDWQGAGSVLLRAGLALALLSAPTLFHRAELDTIFIGLTGRVEATNVTDALILVLPITLGVGLIALVSLWRAGRRAQALGGLAALTAMIVLPPILGFALYFCLFHSPRHFHESLTSLSWVNLRQWWGVVLPLSLAAGAIAVLIFGLELRTALTDQIMAASFMTLSTLTVPHMLAPMIAARLSRQDAYLNTNPTP